jgi:GxxExxY protein
MDDKEAIQIPQVKIKAVLTNKITSIEELQGVLPQLCDAIYHDIGPYYDEHAYETALYEELKKRIDGQVQRQLEIPVMYGEYQISNRRLDILVTFSDTKGCILELKAQQIDLTAQNLHQLKYYMHVFKVHHGFLIKFPRTHSFPSLSMEQNDPTKYVEIKYIDTQSIEPKKHRYVPTMEQIIGIYTTGQNPDPERISQLTVDNIVHSMTYKHITGNSKSSQYRRKKYNFPLTLEPPPSPHPNCTFCDPEKLLNHAKSLQSKLIHQVADTLVGSYGIIGCSVELDGPTIVYNTEEEPDPRIPKQLHILELGHISVRTVKTGPIIPFSIDSPNPQ